MLPIKQIFSLRLQSRGKYAFINSLDKNSKILDVGCGSNSPNYTKTLLPDCNYIGLDIQDYNQTRENLADEYIITNSENFVRSINELDQDFDAVICAHNIEHCEDRFGTIAAITRRLRVGGKAYLSFPTSSSKGFPSRKGCLNYFDDPTHLGDPPDFEENIESLEKGGLDVIFQCKSYRPIILAFIGLVMEPISIVTKKVYPGTWALYGFESIIIAEKRIE